ncbi:hypothetical protein CH375_13725 [Leptospira ellisii]|uniref:Uncharacterized protein n=1 Tax=Leptospira ellisii TaxID=2023197 RepID=A0A2N0BJE6_9LEPT|nr:hypothetical protein CH379_03285 [Leptospira ellisii]PKA03978.1 hypothetical protein CH375_13725 [Leptospira ellisii]
MIFRGSSREILRTNRVGTHTAGVVLRRFFRERLQYTVFKLFFLQTCAGTRANQSLKAIFFLRFYASGRSPGRQMIKRIST